MYLQWGDAGLKCLFLVVVFIFCARGETWKKSGHIAIIQFTLAFNPSHFPRAAPNYQQGKAALVVSKGQQETENVKQFTCGQL